MKGELWIRSTDREAVAQIAFQPFVGYGRLTSDAVRHLFSAIKLNDRSGSSNSPGYLSRIGYTHAGTILVDDDGVIRITRAEATPAPENARVWTKKVHPDRYYVRVEGTPRFGCGLTMEQAFEGLSYPNGSNDGFAATELRRLGYAFHGEIQLSSEAGLDPGKGPSISYESAEEVDVPPIKGQPLTCKGCGESFDTYRRKMPTGKCSNCEESQKGTPLEQWHKPPPAPSYTNWQNPSYGDDTYGGV